MQRDRRPARQLATRVPRELDLDTADQDGEGQRASTRRTPVSIRVYCLPVPVPCQSQTPRIARHHPPPRWHCCASAASAVVVSTGIADEQPASNSRPATILIVPRTAPSPPHCPGLATSSPRSPHPQLPE